MRNMIILLVLAFMAMAGTAHAQTAQEPRTICGQDARTFTERTVLGRRLLVCSDGAMSEALVIDGQLKFVEVEALTSDQGRDRIDDAADEREWRSSGYGRINCSRYDHRRLRECRQARLGRGGSCRGLASGRRVDAATCDRWRDQLSY